MRLIWTFLLVFFALSCKHSNSEDLMIYRSDITSLCHNCQSSNLYKVSEDVCLISYIKSSSEGQDSLAFRTWRSGNISEEQIITYGDNWFVNWADIPSITSVGGSEDILIAHWLQMSAEGTYDYDIHQVLSRDGGSSWENSVVLNEDMIAAEHGFVTMTATAEGTFVCWLDGRNTKTPIYETQEEKPKNDHDHSHGGATHHPMTLRAAWIGQSGQKIQEMEVDNRVCDCCQTDAVITKHGPVIAYRDRSEGEIRDISIAKYVNDTWSTKPIHQDNWKIAGCPVNGPALAYKDKILAAAWYTEMNDIPKVFLSISHDEGESFETPIMIAEGTVLGRVDIALKEGRIIVTWMENKGDKTFINSRIYDYQSQKLMDTFQLETTSHKRSAGFPIVEYLGNDLLLLHTTLQEDSLSVSLKTIKGL